MKMSTTFTIVFIFASLTSFTCHRNADEPKYETRELIMQPGPDDGQDCLVAYRETDNGYYAGENHILNPDVTAIRWTYAADNAGEGTNRTYLKFEELSNISDDAEILEAKLSLFGVSSGVAAPLGNSFYPSSPYEVSGSNAAWLKRVLSDWSESSITWNNKPATTDEDQATIPPSNTQWNFDAPNVDVTDMVKVMVNDKKNYGFCLQLKTEEIYRSILFGSSESSDVEKRPKLVVKYRIQIRQ